MFRASAIVRCCPCTRRDAPEARARHSPPEGLVQTPQVAGHRTHLITQVEQHVEEIVFYQRMTARACQGSGRSFCSCLRKPLLKIDWASCPSEPPSLGKGLSRCLQTSAESTLTPKRISAKMRRRTLEAYKQTFLVPAKLIERRAVYLSRETQERADFVVRRLGDRGANLSSFVERIVCAHLEDYAEEIEEWRKL